MSVGLYHQETMKIATRASSIILMSLLTVFLATQVMATCSAFPVIMSIDELAERADVILIGRVESIIHSPEDPEIIPMTNRKVVVSVERYLKKPLNSTEVSVLVRGANMGNYTVWVEDQPGFEESEQVLLFLRDDPSHLHENPHGYFETVGLFQGKFTIEGDVAYNEMGYEIKGIREPIGSDTDYRAMIEEADFVIVGNVTNVYETNYVYVTIDIEEFVTNSLNISQISLSARNREAGILYEDGSISSTNNGDLFNVGEKVFVFVERTDHSFWVLHGVVGKYRVWGNSNISLARRKIIDGWYVVPDFRYKTVVFSDATNFTSAGGSGRTIPDHISYAAAELPIPESTLIWPNIIIAVITVLIVSLLVLVIWRKMRP